MRTWPPFLILAPLCIVACSDSTGVDGRDTKPPTLTLDPVDSVSAMLSVTISGTVRDSGQVVRVTIQMREACCDGPVDTLSLVPAVDVPFSAASKRVEAAGFKGDSLLQRRRVAVRAA